jgi:TolB-like protein
VDRQVARRFESARDLGMALRALLTGSAAKVSGRRPRARGKSLAVLPFVNSGADPRIEYLTDGITESIINSLSQLSGLRVVPRSLVFRYKGLQSDPATVGLALNARTILTGRVVPARDVLNIQAEPSTQRPSRSCGASVPPEDDGSASPCRKRSRQISEVLPRLTGAPEEAPEAAHGSARAHQCRGPPLEPVDTDGFRRARALRQGNSA